MVATLPPWLTRRRISSLGRSYTFNNVVIFLQYCRNIIPILLPKYVDDRQYFRSVANGTNVWLGGFSRKPNEWAWTDDSEWVYDEWKVRVHCLCAHIQLLTYPPPHFLCHKPSWQVKIGQKEVCHKPSRHAFNPSPPKGRCQNRPHTSYRG